MNVTINELSFIGYASSGSSSLHMLHSHRHSTTHQRVARIGKSRRQLGVLRPREGQAVQNAPMLRQLRHPNEAGSLSDATTSRIESNRRMMVRPRTCWDCIPKAMLRYSWTPTPLGYPSSSMRRMSRVEKGRWTWAVSPMAPGWDRLGGVKDRRTPILYRRTKPKS